MAQKRMQNKEKKSNSNEIIGIVLIMVSGFFLLCLCIDIVLGAISQAVKAWTVGVLGFMAYPIFAALLVAGIAVLQRRRVTLKAKYIAGIIAITVFAALILQLATSYKFLEGDIASYISKVYKSFTAGGVLFGVVAYGVQSAITPVFSYVVYSLGIALTATLLSWDKLKRTAAFNKQSESHPAPVKTSPFDTKEYNSKRTNLAKSLYVNTIIPQNKPYEQTNTQYQNKNYESAAGQFSDMREQPKINNMQKYSQTLDNSNYDADSFIPYSDEKKDDKKTRARNLLNEVKNAPFAAYSPYSAQPPSTSSSSSSKPLYKAPYVPQVPPLITSAPDIKNIIGETASNRPPKIVHLEDTGLQRVAMPPVKDFEDDYIGGHIINGDELSRQIARERNPESETVAEVKSKSYEEKGILSYPQIPEKNIESEAVERAPIMNGDFFKKGPAQDSPVFNAFKPQPEPLKPETEPVKQQPVINSYISPEKFEEAKIEEIKKPAETPYRMFGIPEIFIPPIIGAMQKSQVISNEIINGDSFPRFNQEKDFFEEKETPAPVPSNNDRFKSVENFLSPDTKPSNEKYEEKSGLKENIFGFEKKSSLDFKPKETEELNNTNDDDYIFETDNRFKTDTFEFEKPLKEEKSDFNKILEFEKNKPLKTSLDDELIYDDEVEDLSERSFSNENDTTGYYNAVKEDKPKAGYKAPVGFGENKSTAAPFQPDFKSDAPLKLRPENQIKMDDYAREIAPPVKQKIRKPGRYLPPPVDFLINSKNSSSEATEADSSEKAKLLEETLSELKLPATVCAIIRGPTVTRYELEMPPGIPVKRIEQYAKDIEYNLAIKGKIRIETPIPGKRAVGIEIPNEVVDIVRLKEIISSKEFVNAVSPVTLCLGKDIAGSVIVCQLDKMPHLLIAGQTGSGKSACLNSIIMSILYKSTPDDVRLILIDPKRVEFTVYRDMPHLLTNEIITESIQTLNALKWLRAEMERRYSLFSKNIVRNLTEYNKLDAVKNGEMEKLPMLVLIIDEMADLMLSENRKDLEERIMALTAKSRAAGIHLILATQRPSVDVITGTIKANLPSCIAFAVKSVIDSRTILDSAGAEALLGNGDMIYAPVGNEFTRRVQGAFVTNEEVTMVVNYVRDNNTAEFDDEFKASLDQKEEMSEMLSAPVESEFDALMPSVLRLVIETGQVSTTFIQQRFSVGYPRASKIMYQMEKNNFISLNDGSNKPRTVYITREKYKEMFKEEV